MGQERHPHEKDSSLMDNVVDLAKRRGFVFAGSDIYGGLANSWDYGPLGVELKNNLRDWWWKRYVHDRSDMVGLDAAIMMNPKVWEASGHLANFNDVQVDCRSCNMRYRADHLIASQVEGVNVEGLKPAELTSLIREKGVKCPNCGSADFTDARIFNLMFETSMGTIAGEKNAVYLRSELAQGMFVDFRRILDATRKRLPFGIAQAGKVFRNEITPGNFIFRTLEFDLMEFEYFVRESEWEKTFEYWLADMRVWLGEMGFDPTHIRVREHTKEELSHYSKRTADIEYRTPFGWKEMFGLAYRSDFDLANHMKHSGVDLRYTDPMTKEKFIPHVIEPTFGLTRLLLMVLLEAYREDEVKDAKGESATRTVLKLSPRLAPYTVAVLPLSKKEELSEKARGVRELLRKSFVADYDETQSIGKRYRRQDEIGTPFCVTVDFESLTDHAVTVRDRDTVKQERVSIQELVPFLQKSLAKFIDS